MLLTAWKAMLSQTRLKSNLIDCINGIILSKENKQEELKKFVGRLIKTRKWEDGCFKFWQECLFRNVQIFIDSSKSKLS